jgi:hypothetical protein
MVAALRARRARARRARGAVDARGLRAADPVRNGKSNIEYGAMRWQ